MSRGHRALLGLALFGLLLQPTQAPAEILHVYDRLSRLRATVDPAADDAAVWTYDAVGNIVGITRQPATQTTILELPAEAVAGACGVRVLGIGFSATPGQNTVTVSGVAATVQTATATELVVCLGAGTTTGSVVVTTPTGSDTSDGPLPVQAAAPVPTISGFTPGVAVWGAALSVTGTNFDPGPGRTRLRMGATALYAPVSAVTATSLGTTVPPGTTSGRLTLTTPAGTAVAPSDVFIPPAPYTAADVTATGRLALTGSQTVTIPALKQALFVFDGTVGQKVCVGTALVSGPSLETAVYQPSGATWVTPQFYGGTAVEMAPLPAAGTYTIRVRSGSTTTTSVETVTLHDASDRDEGPIAPDGTAKTVTFGTPCYRAKVTFAGTTGQRVSLTATPSMTAGSLLTLANPDGTTLATLSAATSGQAFLEPVTLPQTGTYSLWVDPNGSATGSMTLRLYALVDVTATATINGGVVPLSLPNPGQRAFVSVANDTAGRLATVSISSNVVGLTTVSLLRPDGTVQVSDTRANTAFSLPQQTLAVVGTYQILVDPVGSRTGTLGVQVTSP